MRNHRPHHRSLVHALLLSAAVFFLYGGILLALLHNNPGVSWLGHASGFVVGVLCAWWTRRFNR